MVYTPLACFPITHKNGLSEGHKPPLPNYIACPLSFAGPISVAGGPPGSDVPNSVAPPILHTKSMKMPKKCPNTALIVWHPPAQEGSVL